MRRAFFRQMIGPAYLFLCILIGGSAQAIWGNLILQLIGLVLIGWAAVRSAEGEWRQRGAFRMLCVIALSALSLIALQLVPLPPELWTRLPGRNLLVQGYSSLGENLPWLPISMTPFNSLSCALFLIPPLAIIFATLVLDACRINWAIASILGATLLSIALGYAQVSSKAPGWYLYEFTNLGSAVGFFANRNHMGTLLLTTIPFIALVLSRQAGDQRKSLPISIAAVASGVFVLLGIAMNGSLAAVSLALPVIAGSILLFRWTSRFRSVGLAITACAFPLMVALLANSPVEGKLTGTETSSITGRQEIWGTSLKAGAAALPVGTGFGSFVPVYRLYEDPNTVTSTYVIHAHNDFIELFVEGGIPALLLVAIFLFWWTRRVIGAWRPNGSGAARAATIASLAMLAHSVVDYPLRTASMAVIFGFCLALMTRRSDAATHAEPSIPPDLRPARHVTIR